MSLRLLSSQLTYLTKIQIEIKTENMLNIKSERRKEIHDHRGAIIIVLDEEVTNRIVVNNVKLQVVQC